MYKNNSLIGITGAGIFSSFGPGLNVLENALLQGKNNFHYSLRFPELSFPVICTELPSFNLEKTLGLFVDLPQKLIHDASRIGRRTPLTVQACLISALEAWQQAGLHKYPINNHRLGIVVAGNNTTQRYYYDTYQSLEKNFNFLSPTYALHFMDTDLMGILSEIFTIHGVGFTVGGASASGNVGIIHAYRLIQQGFVDICMVIGAPADLSPMEVQGFWAIGAMGSQKFQHPPSQACRPFDLEHDGFIPGQSSACLILERIRTKEKDRLLAEIAGTAMNLDGNRYANPSLSGEIKVMQQALQSGRLNPIDIQYINTHGSSSPLGDTTEIEAIKNVFGKEVSKIWLNSTKCITGHCLWSAGIVEAIASLIQLRTGFIHPNLNLENPIDDTCRFSRHQCESARVKFAMSNSFGFGGINSSIILKNSFY